MINSLINIIYPPHCYFCKKLGSYLCRDCEEKKFIKFKRIRCHVCQGQLRNTFIHDLCRRNTYLDGVFASYYLNDDLKNYIKEIKYGLYKEMYKALANFIRMNFSNHPFRYDLITFVPQTYTKDNIRGFNLSQLIASSIDFNFTSILEKWIDTAPQASLNRTHRKNNLINSFKCNNLNYIFNKDILICDDIYTTGRTLEECAKCLKTNGANKVFVFCLAIDEVPIQIESEIKR